MKKILPGLLVFLLSATIGNAQKSKLNAAYNYFKEPYKQYDKAIEAIEEAAVHPQTSGWAKTWYYKGLIYMSLYESETYASLCNNCLQTAYDAFKKSIELDPKNEWVDEINTLRIPYIANKIFSTGINDFQNARYSEALSSFELVQKMIPEDTTVIINSAFSAERAGLKDKASLYYQKLMDMNYSDDQFLLSYSGFLFNNKDTEKALAIIRTGRKLYPDSLSFMLSESNILIQTDRREEAAEALSNAISKDPGNIKLHFALGSTYDQMANAKDSAGNLMHKPEEVEALRNQAIDAYKKGLVLDPQNFEINFNLGAVYYNKGAELANEVNMIKDNKLFEQGKKKFEEMFRSAKPYMEKSLETNPRKTSDDENMYESTITSLKEIYARLDEMNNYNRIKDLLKK
ncbi:MAG: tetratricopeptide repeat protein [Bacteroidetes bacterium]|nr:MAG: tetratricopeptide repeat protein [Bacteroidota bacterium]